MDQKTKIKSELKSKNCKPKVKYDKVLNQNERRKCAHFKTVNYYIIF